MFFAISIGLLSFLAELHSFSLPFSWSKVLGIFCSMGEMERGQIIYDFFMELKFLTVSTVATGVLLPVDPYFFFRKSNCLGLIS